MTPATPPPTPQPATPPPAPPATLPAPRLHADVSGRGTRLVLAHGFTQTGRVWGSLDEQLVAGRQLIRVDMPGHAGSTELAVSLPDGADLLGDLGGRADYLGYSMGARFCLLLALARPELVERLVLISSTAGIDDPDERRARREADRAMAEEIDPSDPGSPILPVEAFVRRWLDGPMFAGLDDRVNGFEERLRNTGPGLASSLRLAGTGNQDPVWGRLDRLAMPVLLITGEGDRKFTALARRMREAIGANATHVVVEGAGHAPHLQRPDRVAAAVQEHLGPRG